MPMPEPGRVFGHILLDAIVAFDGVSASGDHDGLVHAALRLLGEHPEIVPVEADEQTEVTVDLSNVVGGALSLVEELSRQLAELRGVDRDTIVSELRDRLDAE